MYLSVCAARTKRCSKGEVYQSYYPIEEVPEDLAQLDVAGHISAVATCSAVDDKVQGCTAPATPSNPFIVASLCKGRV